ncbi:non-lysosomal glucosylceramidase [Citrus sinensis]|uniref:Non-lysosomal glucosylceramidase n=1 Tax=Citrus sinensis TaxID=2711 RepID=A0ACB8I1M7_CITSI|nr:non-lysosomal glucosylceramidase [Citrus sinensis]
MVSGNLFHCRKHSWPPEEYVGRATLQLLDFDSAAPPEQAWRRRLNSHANILKEFSVTFMEAIKMVRLGIRLWSYVREEASHGRKAPIDPFTRISCKPSASQGVPLGGMGKAGDQGIDSWGWNLSGQHSTYHALFPRAWTIYDGEPDPELKISCRQISPFIPHNYRDSSLPTAVFVYTNSIGGISHLSGDHVNEPFLTARGNPPVTFAVAACETQNVNVTVLPCFGLSEGSCVTAKGMWGTMVQDGQFDRENFKSGPSMPSSPGEALCAAVSASAWVEPHGKCTVAFALAWSSPKVKFLKGSSYHRRYTKFYGTSEGAAQDLVHDALMSMYLWFGCVLYSNEPNIAFRNLDADYKRWEEDIEKWQNPILRDDRLPEWYKFTLFNELYFLVAGGTVWIDSRLPAPDKRNHRNGEKTDVKGTEAEVNLSDGALVKHTTTSDYYSEDESVVNHEGSNSYSQHHPITLLNEENDSDDGGRFLYLEGVEYVMWCTYDVHFYASFALLELFPKIELNIQRDFAKAVLSEDGRKVKFLAEGNTGIRKLRGAVPHDLGTHDPWNEMNAYNIHDTSQWKDLNPKFVLQVYRDFAATGDMSFGVDVWPAVRAAMEYMEQFDRDGDCLIENDGFPDQTYDTWTVHGVSAYCGCLWLAALQAAAAMALQLGDKPFAEYCKGKFLKAKSVFEEKLWNGSYFNYDSGSSSNSKSIQTDQLAGQWYTASSGLPSLFDEAQIKSTLQKIFDFNVMKVKGGRMGAVNGMHPNGKVDETCMQSREIWTGVTYGVAATMILAGMEKEAFTTAEGIFTAGWSEEGYGYWFQTPEAWTMDGHFRSLIYMRPLSIWGMQWALSMPKTVLQAPEINIMDRISISPSAAAISHEFGVRKITNKAKCFGAAVFHCSC